MAGERMGTSLAAAPGVPLLIALRDVQWLPSRLWKWSLEPLSYESPVASMRVPKAIHSDNISSLENGEHENQLSESGEVDLHTHLKNCKKNPGHPEFIPVESFSLEHLPEGHHDSDLFEFIKATADLTVRLSVTMTSPDRPEFWPNTKIPYFLSELRGKETFRTGTGRVRSVCQYQKEYKQWDYTTCPCDQCKSSDDPSKVWWKIYVATAALVVFDDTEASHTTLTLFYDSEDSEVVIVKDSARVRFMNIERECCVFSCVTCDEKVGNKLVKMLKHFNDVRTKVRIKSYASRDDSDKLSFIVSHPHGLCKQVSVGQWKDKVEIEVMKYLFDTKFTYTTCTCPGSSGAYVHCMGCVGGTWFADQVHGGRLKSGLSYSGFVSDKFA